MSRLIQSVLAISLWWVAGGLAVAADSTPGQAASAPQVQSISIQSVKPDASDAPGYAEQTNQQRAAVQPGNNAPMWRDVGRGAEGYTSLPKSQAPEAGVLIQPFVQYPGSRLTNAGEAWRQVRNQWIIPYGGSFLLVVLGAIAIFYWRQGAIRVHGKPTGVVIERFTPLERAAHWANAMAFVVLAVSGVTMAFGKFFIQPFIGDMLFGWLAYVLKNAHNFAGPLFAVSLLIVFITFVKDNLPQAGDLAGLFSRPLHRRRQRVVLGDHLGRRRALLPQGCGELGLGRLGARGRLHRTRDESGERVPGRGHSAQDRLGAEHARRRRGHLRAEVREPRRQAGLLRLLGFRDDGAQALGRR